MSRESDIVQFVEDLSAAEPPDDLSVNIYHDPIKRKNLVNWLSTFDAESPTAMFVGEAPGSFGARITGVPFTSPYTITSLIDPWHAFGPDAGYEVPEGEDVSQKEAAATLFWRHVMKHFKSHPRPMTWNAFPFWPRQRNADVNRNPSISEVRAGSEWLRRMVEMHPNAKVIAVGRSAEYAMRLIQVDYFGIRHPSHGGASEFDDGITKFLASLAEK